MPANPDLLKRITTRPEVLGGKPIIRDMRMAVEHVLGMMARGETPETILDDYPFPRTRRHTGVPTLRPPSHSRRARVRLEPARLARRQPRQWQPRPPAATLTTSD